MNHKLFLVSLFFLTSCSINPSLPELPNFSQSLSKFSELLAPHIYKKDTKQGSVLRVDKFSQIQLGQNKDKIQKLIGSPSIVDPFHNNRWEYIHHTITKNNELISYRVILTFKNNILVDISDFDIETLKEVEKQNIDFSTTKTDIDQTDKDNWYKFW